MTVLTESAAERSLPPETILFVEDEPLVRMDMAEFLRQCGYQVHEAADAHEAVEALQAKFVIDLVFTDINLPKGITGLELAEWVLMNRPGVTVLLTTGRVMRVNPRSSFGPILAKPYTGRDLLQRVLEALVKRAADAED